MFVKLLSPQVTNWWELIWPCIEKCLPPCEEKEKRQANILQALLEERMQVWVMLRKEEGVNKILAILSTTVTQDECSKTKSLLIYSLFSYSTAMTAQDYTEGFEGLQKFARSKGCESVSAFTNLDKIVALIKRHKGSSEFRFISLPV
jgi:hypothetical protein